MPRSVLVIDDDVAIRDAFSSSLEAVGYQVDAAASGEEGVQKAKKKSFDLIFLDLRMPGVDGVAALKMIRQFNSTVPIYIVTAFLQEYLNSLESAKKEGIDFELLKKPLERDQIQTIAKSILG